MESYCWESQDSIRVVAQKKKKKRKKKKKKRKKTKKKKRKKKKRKKKVIKSGLALLKPVRLAFQLNPQHG